MAHVLVVDDDMSIRAFVLEILEEEGHSIEEAVDGKQGLQRYREEPADLVITDILMPEVDGVEFIMQLQEIYPGVKIIAMSGGGRGLDASFNLRIAKDFGAVQQIEKPFTRERLLEAVRQVVD
ncbi:MAG: response regulator [Magnetococcales bacterium]|nr:response regulator [Magnetococcales bacterium]